MAQFTNSLRDLLIKCLQCLTRNKTNNQPHPQKNANWMMRRTGLLSAIILLFSNLTSLTVLQKCVKHKTHIQMSCLRNTQLKPKSQPNSCWQDMLHNNRSSHRIPWASSQNKLLPNSPPKIPGLNTWKIGPTRTRITLRKLRDGWQPVRPTRQSRPSYSSWLMQTEALPERRLILGTSTGLSTWRSSELALQNLFLLHPSKMQSPHLWLAVGFQLTPGKSKVTLTVGTSQCSSYTTHSPVQRTSTNARAPSKTRRATGKHSLQKRLKESGWDL